LATAERGETKGREKRQKLCGSSSRCDMGRSLRDDGEEEKTGDGEDDLGSRQHWH
jgi:hypothetical protein